MSEPKFTKGPWHQDKWGSVKAPNGESVRFGALTLALSGSDEVRANDALACAAPELFDALEKLTREFVKVFPIYYYAEPWAHDRNEALKSARSAIAKAFGEPPCA
ncbi:hypothetical protein NDK50_08210 [Paraburkholderia bryophila]|uniref:hypothetical protein n=1 Tax=Paraburkholderia bryophila TaxID=420952 RepID=UPI0023497A05|nr:hypothetical protein [Paraburkholderia bryophila]WCM21420.1 hypothetical protein NDK50_08210 [Paraburkholderia bryophila]